MTITGTVVYQSIEGGFWGIEADDGQQYLPVGSLPEAVREDGAAIEAEVEPVQALTFKMWGRPVRVHRIARR